MGSNLKPKTMSNFTKTFKSEYHLFGKCTIQKSGNLLFAFFGDEQVVWRENIKDGGAVPRIAQFIEMNSSSYEAEKVVNHLKAKLK